MKPIYICILFASMASQGLRAQEDPLPYAQIPEAPAEYTPGSVVSRMIDGLGFRFYWATEGLRQEDLDYRPGPEARSTWETIGHIHGLSRVILNSALNQPNTTQEPSDLSFEEKRAEVLRMLRQASEIFLQSEDLNDHTIVFEREGSVSEFPLWNQLNGPLADALWHCGQVVSHRRASGNPFNSKVSVFTGKVRD